MSALVNNRFFIFTVIGISTMFILSCADDPLAPQQDHYEAEGIIFYESGIKIAEIFRGLTQDTLFVDSGEQSAGIDVKFYNPDKQEMNPPDPDDHPFDWEVTNTDLLGIWQHPGEEGGYEFHLVGKSAGTTQIEFFIMHDGHPDFRSGKINVTVGP